jgi:hypothetical protein
LLAYIYPKDVMHSLEFETSSYFYHSKIYLSFSAGGDFKIQSAHQISQALPACGLTLLEYSVSVASKVRLHRAQSVIFIILHKIFQI